MDDQDPIINADFIIPLLILGVLFLAVIIDGLLTGV